MEIETLRSFSQSILLKTCGNFVLPEKPGKNADQMDIHGYCEPSKETHTMFSV